MADFEKDGPFGFVMEALARHYPELANPFGSDCPRGPNTSCPAWPERHPRTLEQAIIHLEDEHRIGRDEVTRWLVAHGY